MEISIVIPVYNVESYLKECLESIIHQTFQDYEIICINDCSQDNSLSILEEYQEKYGKIHIINNIQNRGLSYSRNLGMKEAKGKYLLFVDSDDYLVRNALEVMYENAEAQQTEILYFNKSIIYEDGWDGEKDNERNYVNNCEYVGVYSGIDLFVKLMEVNSYKSMNAYTQFFLRDFLCKNNLDFYEGVIHEDFLFYFLCAMKAKRVSDIGEQLYVYRKRTESITANVSNIHVQSIFIAFVEIFNYWKNHHYTEIENNAIRVFVNHVYGIYKSYYKRVAYCGSLPLGCAADQYLFECLKDKGKVYFSKEELAQISCTSNVWVYGAGKIGHEVAIVLENNALCIKGYVVTDKSENQHKVFGWEIFQLDELPLTEGALFIIAVGVKKQTEIRGILKKRGIHNILFAVKI